MAEKKQAKLKVVEELRKLDAQSLVNKVAELKKQLVEQQRAHAAQELPGTHVISKTRKELAKAMTILGETKRAELETAPKEEEEKK